MEIIAQRFRALASPVRIRMLRVLTVLGETSVNELAEATRILPCTASFHLRVLTSSGFLWRRRSGSLVYYDLAGNPSSGVTRVLLDLLRDVFQGVRYRNARRVAECDQKKSREYSDSALFACFTGLTHPRRLQIVREIDSQGTASSDLLVYRLHMSPQACLRHLSKLADRGFVHVTRTGRRMAYSLATGECSVQLRLLKAVLAEMGETR